MLALLLCIISTSLIMVIFKIAGRRGTDPFNIIVINYFIGFLLGLALGNHNGFNAPSGSWIIPAVIIGILFVVMFNIIGRATIKTGITVTTITTKMSVVIPVLFSILYFGENLGTTKLLGIALALLGVFLSVYKKSTKFKLTNELILLPIILFVGVGTLDSLIKYTQEVHRAGEIPGYFSTFLFGVAAVTALAIRILFPKVAERKITRATIITGLFLGIVNFGSVYFIIEALENSEIDSSIVFGINNLGVVSLSLIIATLFFGERLSKLNLAGLAISLTALIILFSA